MTREADPLRMSSRLIRLEAAGFPIIARAIREFVLVDDHSFEESIDLTIELIELSFQESIDLTIELIELVTRLEAP